eukprot:scaffold88685_cov64-Phaeocystis_antarctica.AAC.2
MLWRPEGQPCSIASHALEARGPAVRLGPQLGHRGGRHRRRCYRLHHRRHCSRLAQGAAIGCTAAAAGGRHRRRCREGRLPQRCAGLGLGLGYTRHHTGSPLALRGVATPHTHTPHVCESRWVGARERACGWTMRRTSARPALLRLRGGSNGRNSHSQLHQPPHEVLDTQHKA